MLSSGKYVEESVCQNKLKKLRLTMRSLTIFFSGLCTNRDSAFDWPSNNEERGLSMLHSHLCVQIPWERYEKWNFWLNMIIKCSISKTTETVQNPKEMTLDWRIPVYLRYKLFIWVKKFANIFYSLKCVLENSSVFRKTLMQGKGDSNCLMRFCGQNPQNVVVVDRA